MFILVLCSKKCSVKDKMIFQSPIFFWAFVLLTIPLIVHLFDFRRVSTIRFSNVFFLESLKRQNLPRRNLKERLLLITRVCALGFVILCFTNPVLTSRIPWNEGEHLILVDNSYSLLDNCASSDCFSQIKDLVLDVSDKSASSGGVWIPGWYGAKSFFGRLEMQSHLDDLNTTKDDFQLPDLIGKNVFVFSDFQESIIKRIEMQLIDSVLFTLIPVNRSGRSNVRIDTVLSVKSLHNEGNIRRVEVVLSNKGSRGMEGLLIRLEGEGRQFGSTAVSLGPNETKSLEFEIDDDARNFNVYAEDFETPFDNRHFFVLPEFSPISVCVISDGDSRGLEAVFGNKDLFDLDVYDESSVNFKRVFASDLLILDSFEKIPNWFDLQRIKGHLVIVPARNIDISSYSNLLKVKIGESSDTSSFNLSANSIEHPFFKGIFNELSSKVALPRVVAKYSLSGGDVLLAGNNDFLTFLEEQRIYWFASPLDEPYSNIKNHSLFLPLMYRMAESSRAYNEPLSYELNNSPLEMEVQTNPDDVPVLVNETGRFIPELSFSGSTLVFTLPPDLNEPGIYYLVSGIDTLKAIALNYPQQESMMDFMGYEELTDHFRNEPNVRVLDTNNLSALEANLEQMDSGIALWKYGLILVLMCLLAETAIHRWM